MVEQILSALWAALPSSQATTTMLRWYRLHKHPN